ncbi:choice-of-anchor R domain-containing protein [Corallincola spongiicola]|uniref:PEP-CTERM sorting domain-containing protein n=1 Tax=Corallincola spongiicola TaxID=2520508 RepID=A0ABY1WRC0_9GAMM|nr:choice-of-anchor R domain-containing protein [Corallincola spongiicola]TAA47264.1 hypothetical protein EXY25_08495 [Corallincola spongiicola]
MEIFIKFIFSSMLILITTATNASPVILYNTFGPDDDFSTKNSNSGFSADIGLNPYTLEQQKVANGFSISSGFVDITLESIEVALSNPRNNDGSNRVTLTLHNDLGGVPGAAIESLSVELAPKYSHQMYFIESATNPTLFAGSNYWLVASALDPMSELGWLWNGIAPWNTDTGPRLSYRSGDGIWKDRSKYGQQAFRINANATVVPTPSSVILFVGSLLCLAGRHRLSERE